MFPSGSTVRLRVSERSRASAGVSMDGRTGVGISMDGDGNGVLGPGESVVVQASPFPVPCVNRSSIVDEDNVSEPMLDGLASGEGWKGDLGSGDGFTEGARPGKEDDWVRDINNLLQYNATFRSKALLRHSRT